MIPIQKKVVISEIGTISTLGSSFSEVAKNLEYSPTIAPIQNYEFHSLTNPINVFSLAPFDPEIVLGKKGLRTKDWATKLLLGAIELGFKELYEKTPESDRPGLCLGTAFGSVQSIGDFLSDSIVNGVNSVNPQAFANTVTNAPISNANIRHIVRSLSATVSTGFNASHDALMYGYDYLARGYGEWIITGGFEELSYYELLGLDRSGVLSKSGVMQPFGINSDGMVMGEGCAMFVLETEDHALARGAHIIAELAGIASGFDPAIDPVTNRYETNEFSRIMSVALQMACVEKSECGFIAASANGSVGLDSLEAKVYAAEYPNVPVTAYKSRFGECYGASGALSLVCALADVTQSRVSSVFGDYESNSCNLVRKPLALEQNKFAIVNNVSCDGYIASIVVKPYL